MHEFNNVMLYMLLDDFLNFFMYKNNYGLGIMFFSYYFFICKKMELQIN